MVVWLQFLACTAVVLFAGTNLSRYGDVIAEKTGLGRTWIGVILMAAVTSLPELITGISSVAVFDVPDIAVGDVLGSCVFNILIIALLETVGGTSPISTRVHQGQVLTAAFGILLLGLVVLGIAAGPHIPALGWIGTSSSAFLILYFLAMRVIFTYERRRAAEGAEAEGSALLYEHLSRARTYTLYSLNAGLIIAAASFLPRLGEQIAEMTGLGQSFVGNIFIAMSTSLPEVAVSVAALRMGAVDMMVGGLLGSNLFNIAILGVDDILYLQGPLLASIESTHLVTAAGAIAMTAIAIAGLTYRMGKKLLFFTWDSLGIMVIYVLVTVVLYLMR